MINAVSETLSQKTITQYRIIEERYEILQRYLKLFIKKNRFMEKDDLELILMALSNEPIEEDVEISDKYTN